MQTLLEILRKTEAFLASKGIPDPRLDAQYILAHALSMERMGLYLNFDRPLRDAELVTVRELLRRRSRREPLQHVLGEAHFRRLRLHSDARALVPRPETEVLVDLALNELGTFQTAGVEAPRMLDIGTGTGAIALAVAVEFPAAEIVATDVSEDALAIAQENATLCGIAERVRFIESDLFAWPEVQERFHLIVSNPPYIPSALIAELEPEVRDGDPRLALDGGADGLDIVRRILSGAERHLFPGGCLLMELGHDQGPQLQELCAQMQGWNPAELYPDLSGVRRFFKASLRL